ncbi:Pleckstrin -like proteiny domain-containing family F member 1 [Collichthys lucidus]|uniref:Pleckstrin-like proteiny domain-containing family F member 1 n=1 Tax=Collichthys lucidus TaxID=240159 RepID=A0A4U5TV22_COLLU|nr:Pleckstrin -like proteiny domain-containing family F member 1 [Collichthys lucidus]
MVDHLAFSQENRERIHTVENSFGPPGKTLFQPGRVLIGEGRLMKQSRRDPQPKAFFLFNDVLVYGSIILSGCWHKKQKIIRLASSYEEKRAWIEHIEDCQTKLLQNSNLKPGSTFAVTWVPDEASAICMRCSNKFSVTQRRHHCRICGFVVCGACFKKRAMIRHIHPTKWLRVFNVCHPNLSRAETEPQDISRVRGDSTGKISSDEDEVDEGSFEKEGAEEQMEDQDPSRWMDSWSPYDWLLEFHFLNPSA